MTESAQINIDNASTRSALSRGRRLDPDPEVLKRARHKAESAGLAITWQQGFADLPREEGDYDKAVSSLMFHHLSTEAKRRALASVLDQLKPGGELHIADWGRPQNLAMRMMFLPVQLLDGLATRHNLQGRLPEFMREIGFEDVCETRRWATALGVHGRHQAYAGRDGDCISNWPEHGAHTA